MNQSLALNPPVRGQWAILNPPGHAKLAFDFLAVDDQRSPYNGVSLLRHIFSTISVDATLAWGKPVFAVMDGTMVAASDGMPDREQISMARDLFRLMFFGPKEKMGTDLSFARTESIQMDNDKESKGKLINARLTRRAWYSTSSQRLRGSI